MQGIESIVTIQSLISVGKWRWWENQRIYSK